MTLDGHARPQGARRQLSGARENHRGPRFVQSRSPGLSEPRRSARAPVARSPFPQHQRPPTLSTPSPVPPVRNPGAEFIPLQRGIASRAGEPLVFPYSGPDPAPGGARSGRTQRGRRRTVDVSTISPTPGRLAAPPHRASIGFPYTTLATSLHSRPLAFATNMPQGLCRESHPAPGWWANNQAHDIHEDGTVTPSLRCDCGWHVFARLLDWRPE